MPVYELIENDTFPTEKSELIRLYTPQFGFRLGPDWLPQRFLLRSQLSDEASAALRAAGVAGPPTLRELP